MSAPDNKYNLIYYIGISLLTALGTFCFWLRMPEMLSYQEQYQLFLFTGDYCIERITEVGGFSDYIGEFVTQFYYVPWLGALMIALTLTALQCITGIICVKSARALSLKTSLYALSAVPVILILHSLGDENVLMSFPVALLITQLAVLLIISLPLKGSILYGLSTIILFFVVYWLAGPVAILLPIEATLLKRNFRFRWIWIIASLIAAYCTVLVLHRTLYAQYPISRLLQGLNYYRIPNIYPTDLYISTASVLAVCLLSLIPLKSKKSYILGGISAAAVMVFALIFIPKGYDENKIAVLRYDYLVRNERWHDIIQEATDNAPTNSFALQALNLALAKTGQLGDRMFEFPQTDIGGLIAKYQRDNTTCLITAEAFYHLGMVNSAFRYNFDLQEAIMNDRKSGRFFKRMAECLIINGKYKAAAKYLNKLKSSLYYSDWAKEAEKYLGHEDMISQHPEWGEKRRIRFKQEMLYDYPEIEKMLGLLAIESNGANLLAWDYFNAATLLKGDLPTFTGMYHYGNESFGLTSIPKHHQEALAMYWTFGHPTFDGIPYPLSDNVKDRIASLAQAVMINPNNPGAWAPQFGDTYCVYFLKKQSQNSAPADTSKGSARGD